MPSTTRSRRRGPRALSFALLGLVVLLTLCVLAVALWQRLSREQPGREVTLAVAYSPEKEELFSALVAAFNATKPRLPNGQTVQIKATAVTPDEMVAYAGDNLYQALSPDSSLWLAEVDRAWRGQHPDAAPLVGETTRYMVSPIVIAMWQEVAASLGYPGKELGWQDLLRAASNPEFKWSHPSTGTASGLLATLAEFYAGAGLTRDLTEEAATAPATLDYVARLERTVKHYGEGELAVIQQIQEKGRSYLDAFVIQEQLLIRYNQRQGKQLVAIYPVEGTMWADHPLALLEHPALTAEQRLAYAQFKEYLTSEATQKRILQAGYRPTNLLLRLDGPDSPFKAENGVDPAKPYTTLQIPSPSVISVVKNVWQYTKRKANIYLVADTSGSMAGAKLQDAQEALRLFIAQIEGGQERVGLIAFADAPREVVPLVQLGEGRERLNRAVDGLVANGSTALLDAVDLALTRLQALNDKERINTIVVMTDGRENHSRTTVNALVEKLRRQNKTDLPIVVFCIAYGRDADFQMLEQLSSAGGGFTRRGELETIKELYKTLSTYF